MSSLENEPEAVCSESRNVRAATLGAGAVRCLNVFFVEQMSWTMSR